MTNLEYKLTGGRFLERKYGITRADSERLIDLSGVEDAFNAWLQGVGYSVATNSSVARGKLIELIEQAELSREPTVEAPDAYDPNACPGCGGNCRTACR